MLFTSLEFILFAAVAVALRTLCEPGDEVIFLSPPWFFYELLVLAAGAVPVSVPIEPPNFDPPIDAVAKAITPKTRAIIVNSPHNPSGRVWSKDEFAALAAVLEAQPNPIWLVSDEAYAKVVFDGRRAPSPADRCRARPESCRACRAGGRDRRSQPRDRVSRQERKRDSR